MQNTQQNSYVENVINMVWDFISHARGIYSIDEIFTSTLTILYAFHKGYNIKVLNHHQIEFTVNDDNLYRELVNLIPNDRHLHFELCQFINKFSNIDRHEFNSVYVEVLKGLYDLISSNSGRESGEFYTPSAITKLMAYIVNKEECKTFFDPFCGTASIVHEFAQLGGNPYFHGHELNYKTSLFARISTEALYGYDECISNVDSILNWDCSQYDAIVSCPPFGLRLSPEQMAIARNVTPNCSCKSFESVILLRPFYCNYARITVTHLTTGFCFRGSRDYELRRELLEQNLVDTIISLPSNILYGTSISSIILVCKRGRNSDEPIKFIHAEDYVLGERRKRTFDYERFIKMIESDASDIVHVTLEEIRRYDYNLNPSLYYKKDFALKDGQKVVRIKDLITSVEGERLSSINITDSVSINSLSKDFIEVLLNNGKLSNISEARRNISYRVINACEEKYILVSSNTGEIRFGINTDCKGFVYPIDIKVYKVNENLVTPEYLLYTLINHNAINKGRMPLSGYMMLPIVIDSLDKQKECVNKEIQNYEQKINAEREADSIRLGVKQNVSDLEHMLGSTQLRISKIINRLENATPLSDNYPHLVKSIKDNVEYMNRIIHYNNARIESESFNMKDGNIQEFIKSYVDAWNNYGGEYFELTIQDSLKENTILSFDKTLLTVMLDSILNNAIRHGFHKRKNYTEHNSVQISISVVEYKSCPYLLLTVSNNGDPIVDGFTIDDYISRGRYSAFTGRSGLGGHHVYQIVKGHDGYIYLDSNKMWNMIVEILLPLKSTMFNEIPVYENECI